MGRDKGVFEGMRRSSLYQAQLSLFLRGRLKIGFMGGQKLFCVLSYMYVFKKNKNSDYRVEWWSNG